MGFKHAIRAAQGARSYQEDAAAVADNGDVLLAVLADGMGGHAGGAVASELASTAFLEAMAPDAMSGTTLSAQARSRLAVALGEADTAIGVRAAQQPELNGMGCTLVGVVLGADGVDWISVGDSPLYLVHQGTIKRLNEDHSLAPEIDRLAEMGLLSRAAADADSRRHILRSALTGTEIDMIDRPRSPLPLAPGDWVVLASDGIHSISENQIAEIVAAAVTPDAAAEALLAAVAAVGDPYQDNTTVVAVQVGTGGGQ